MSENEFLFRISQITTYVSKWVIKAKVVNKTKLSTFKNNNSFFSIDITDVHGDSISCKFWGSSADKWFNLIELKKVYVFSKGRVAIANQKYSNSKHKYEIVFSEDSEIHEVRDDGEIQIKKKINLVTLRDIKTATKETPFTADLIGIVKHIGVPSMLKTKQGNEVQKQNIIIVDDTKHSFEISFWDNNVNLIQNELVEDEIYVFTNISIRNWNDMKNGTFNVTSSIEKVETLDDDIKKKCTDIHEWYKTEGKFEQFTNMKNVLANDITKLPEKHYALTDINEVATKVSGTYTVIGRVKKIFWKNKENEHKFYYPACLKCKKKLLINQQPEQEEYDYDRNDEVSYTCMHCEESNVKPNYNFTFNFLLMDFSGVLILRAFAEEGYNLLGMKAEELKGLDDDSLDYLFNYDFLFKEFKMVVRVQQKVYNGVERTNFTAMRITPIGHLDLSYLVHEAETLLQDNKTLTKGKRALENETDAHAKKQKV